MQPRLFWGNALSCEQTVLVAEIQPTGRLYPAFRAEIRHETISQDASRS